MTEAERAHRAVHRPIPEDERANLDAQLPTAPPRLPADQDVRDGAGTTAPAD